MITGLGEKGSYATSGGFDLFDYYTWGKPIENWINAGVYGESYPIPKEPWIAAPETKEEMTVGGSWTPIIAAEQTKEDYQKYLQGFFGEIDSEVNKVNEWKQWILIGGGILFLIWLGKKR